MKWNFNIERWKTPLILALILLGVLVRLLYLGTMPDGVNQDEAMAAYESYSLIKTGVDMSGYHNPVYLEAWGDGMNALETYLMVPAISIFGLELFAIRLPQALIGCLCLPVFYLLLKRMFDEKTALIGLLILAINPWHIMMCRWALESNLAPAFLLFGLYFFVLGLQKHPAYYLLSALCYGLSLYTYAILWLIVPIVVGCQILYALLSKNARVTGWTIGFVLLLFLFALPLILLMLINQGLLPEIKTSWLSIPEMFGWRSGDLVLRNLIRPGSYLQLLKLFLRQTDDTVFGSFSSFGLYYMFSAPIILYGFFTAIQNSIRAFRARRFASDFFLLLWLFAAVLLSLLLTRININRINAIHLPLIFCCVIGLRRLVDLPQKAIGGGLIALYCVSFLAFSVHYFGSGQNDLTKEFQPEIRNALSYAESLTDDTIVWRNPARYTKILFCTKLDPEVYQETAQYENPDDPTPYAFGRYVIESPDKPELGAKIYLIDSVDSARYLDAGYVVQDFQSCSVAWFPSALGGD